MRIKETYIYIKLRELHAIIQILKAYFYDAMRYIRYSNSTMMDNNADKLRATIILNYHVIEKGLTMAEMKPGFGQEKVLYLCNKCRIFIQNFGNNDNQVNHALSVLEEYIHLHQHQNLHLPDRITASINEVIALKNKNFVSTIDYNLILADSTDIQNASFPIFAKTRKSLRNYSDKDIPEETLKKAISLGQTAPSACNRQPARVHIFSDNDKIKQILSLQNGNRGFGHLSNKLIIVTCDLSGYKTQNERNSCWIDGGIYVMNLLYGLHYEGIGSCVLNWSVDKKKDLLLYKTTNIPKQESIIAIIACGYPKEGSKAAYSLKKEALEVTTFHKKKND